jgi:response regulator RpfG family c-di-GMP phosphodiesterase
MADKRIEILILQDSMEDFELLKMEFEKADVDFRLSHAQTGEAFESILESKLPDVVISDYNIPGYDIFKALDALKGKDYRRPFLLISEALEDEKAVELIIQHGINDYILKDNLKRLIPTVKVEYEKNLADLKLEENNKELAKLSMVASHTHNGVMITNAEGEVEWVNKAFTEITGYSLAETKGIKPGDLLQGKDTDQRTVQRISKKLKKALQFLMTRERLKNLLLYKKMLLKVNRLSSD